jgi:hypothetical protein
VEELFTGVTHVTGEKLSKKKHLAKMDLKITIDGYVRKVWIILSDILVTRVDIHKTFYDKFLKSL